MTKEKALKWIKAAGVRALKTVAQSSTSSEYSNISTP